MRWFRRRPLTPAEIADREARFLERREREQAQANEARLHERRMEIAAGIGSVLVVAHADTWSTMVAAAKQYLMWPGTAPPVTPLDSGLVEVRIGGQHVLTLVHAMKLRATTGRSPVERAFGRRIYTELARTVDAVDAVTKPGEPVPPVVLDARLAEPSP